ncbi:cytochrome P450 [Cunninghamella echinulata]|nr:cytochrome P450 [Cunninghamella echinulata]
MYMKKSLLGWTLQIANPKDAKQVFLKTDLFAKADMTVQKGTLRQDYLRSNNIVFANERLEWKKHRTVYNRIKSNRMIYIYIKKKYWKAFHRSMPIKLFADLTNRSFTIIDNHNDEPIDVSEIFDKLTLDVIGKAGFDYDFNATLCDKSDWLNTYRDIIVASQEPIFFLFPFLEKKLLWLFTKRKQRHKLVTKMHTMLDKVIENKRQAIKNQDKKQNANDDREKDLLTLMLESESNGEGYLTNEELNSNLNIFFLAGADTTSNNIAFCLYFLAKNKDIQQRAREEAIKIFGDDPIDITPTPDQMKELTYINQILKEVLRISGPAVATTPRIVTQNTELSGVFIPKNTILEVAIYDIHHSKYVWKYPETFNPDRFTKDGEAEQKTREGLAWVPFASGSRMCIGMNFSLAEQRVMLLAFLRKYEWELPENSIHKEKLVTNNLFIIKPRDLYIIFKRRY